MGGGGAEGGEPWFICIGCVCVCVCAYICGCLLNILGQVWAGYVCIRKWVMYKDAPGLSPPLPSPLYRLIQPSANIRPKRGAHKTYTYIRLIVKKGKNIWHNFF